MPICLSVLCPQQTSSIELFFSLSSLYPFKKNQRTTRRRIHVNLIQDSISIKFCWTCWHCDLVTDRALLLNDRSQKLRVFPPPKINGNLLLFVSGSTNLLLLLLPQILEGPQSPGKTTLKTWPAVNNKICHKYRAQFTFIHTLPPPQKNIYIPTKHFAFLERQQALYSISKLQNNPSYSF